MPITPQGVTASTGCTHATRRIWSRRSICKQQQQLRTLHWGPWSAYLNPELQKKAQRRHMRHRYLEAFNAFDRNLYRGRHNSFDPNYLAMKGFMCSAWRSHTLRPGNRWGFVDNDCKSGAEHSQSMRDIKAIKERALKKLLGRKEEMYERLRKGSQHWFVSINDTASFNVPPETTGDPQATTRTQRDAQTIYCQPGQHDLHSSQEYDIDPITNRRVYKHTSQWASSSERDPSIRDQEQQQGFKVEINSEITADIPSGSEAICPVQQGLKRYDDKVAYGPVLYQEPDGAPEQKLDSVRESLKAYEERYPVGIEKPGKTATKSEDTPCPVQEGLKDYDNRATYGAFPKTIASQLRSSNQTILSHSRRQANEIEVERVNFCTVQEGLKDYDDRVNYGLKSCSDHLQAVATEAECVKNGLQAFDDLADYGGKRGVRAKYLDAQNGKTKGSRSMSSEHTEEDLDLLRSSDVRAASGIIRSEAKETEADKHAVREKLEEDFQQQHILSEAASEEALATRNDRLERYKNLEGLKIENSELQNINAHLRGRVNDRLATISTDSSAETPSHELTGNFARDFPEQFQDKWTSTQTGTSQSEGSVTSANPGIASENSPSSDLQYGRLETSLDRLAAIAEAKGKKDFEALKLDNERDPYSTEPTGLETNYAEEVAHNRILDIEGDPYSQIPQGLETSYAEERKLQDRYNTTSHKGSHSVSDLTGSQIAQRGEEGLYNAAPGFATSFETKAKTSTTSSTVYKILAYDPLKKEINLAETTSTIPTSTTPLTPAEVLLSLTNPTKFLPYFENLQAQGYEIASGGTDILVFRKMQGAIMTQSTRETIPNKRVATNPIDGMQSRPIATTGNFASPTGFVNHDLPISDPPFRSQIDVRREEPVFSGRSNWEDDSSRASTKGRGRRLLIGAAWLAGCSYAIGVVAEFFKTGGLDGRGPQSF